MIEKKRSSKGKAVYIFRTNKIGERVDQQL